MSPRGIVCDGWFRFDAGIGVSDSMIHHITVPRNNRMRECSVHCFWVTLLLTSLLLHHLTIMKMMINLDFAWRPSCIVHVLL